MLLALPRDLPAAEAPGRIEVRGIPVTFPAGEESRAREIADRFALRRSAAAGWLGLPEAGSPRLELVENGAQASASAGVAIPDWAVAVTLPDDRVIFRLDRIDRSRADRGVRVAAHEAVHQVLNHVRATPLDRLPRWFEEGLAVYFSGVAYLDPDASIERLAAAGRLPPLEEADERFRADARTAAAAYRMGEVLVQHFAGRFGDPALQRLVHAYRAGAPFERAFLSATGVTLGEFEARWRLEVTPRLPLWLFVLLENLELALLCFGALLVFLAWLRWRARREKAMRSLGVGPLPPFTPGPGGGAPPSAAP